MKTTKPPPAEPRYIDRPEITEAFADRLEHLFFDGTTVRMEFTVVRTDPGASGRTAPIEDPQRWAYTSARIVMSGRSVVQMLNKMLELEAVLASQGLIETRRREPRESS